MKLIQQNKLFFKEGNSDKAYEIDLCEVGSNQFVVNFRYGKRGSALKEGTKTPTPVDRDTAEKVFEALTAEKRKGGYQSEAEMFQVLPVLTSTAPNTVEGAILQRLQNAIDGVNTFKTVWTTSRVAWRVGQIKFAEAVPYLIKLVEKGNDLQRYSILWALARCTDQRAIPTFQAYFSNSKYPANVRKIASEGLLRALKEEEKNKFLGSLIEKLPEEIKQYVVNNQIDALKKCVSERLEEKQTEYNFLENLYAIATEFPLVQKTVAATLSEIALRPPHFKHIRSIFKTAELRDDAQILGVLAYQFEKTPEMYKGVSASSGEDDDYGDYYFKKYIPALNQTVHIKKELKKRDSRIAFSDKTKLYFQRRIGRNLRQIADRDALSYVKFATAILLQYKNEDYTAPYSRSSGYSEYDRLLQKYRHTIIEFPALAKCVLLNQILFGNNPNMVMDLNGAVCRMKETKVVLTDSWRYSASEATENQENTTSIISTALSWVKNLFGSISATPSNNNDKKVNEQGQIVPERQELFPEHWDKMPQAYLQLLLQAHLAIIHEFAYKNLRNHADYQLIEDKIDEEMVIRLLSSDAQIPAWFGLEIAKKRLTEKTDRKFILFLLGTKLAEARQLAQELIEKEPQSFVSESNFVTHLIFNSYKDVRIWAKNFLAKVQFTEEIQKVIVGKSILEMLAIQENTPENNEKVADAIAILLQIAPQLLASVSWKMIEELLTSTLEQNHVLASEILVMKLRNIAADEIPFSILNGFFVSNLEAMRKNGMTIFAQYPEEKLLQAAELLAQMLTSPHENIRSEAKNISKKLIDKSIDFAKQLTDFMIVASMRKETYENSHLDISVFVLIDLKNYLAHISLKTSLKLIYGNYRQGQFIGFHILQNHINPADISIRQVVALGNHELLAIRHWCLDFYNKNILRIRYEREEAIRLLDARWDEVRLAAMDFFRTNFREQDWDIDSLVSVADSVRPEVEAFGKELITRFFQEEDGKTYLSKLSQHPSVNMQLFATNYLERFASDDLERLKTLSFYFRSVLTRVNKARTAKDRIFSFLEKEALKSEPTAAWIMLIFNDILATNAIQDKARCIEILQKLKEKYPDLEVMMEFESLENG